MGLWGTVEEKNNELCSGPHLWMYWMEKGSYSDGSIRALFQTVAAYDDKDCQEVRSVAERAEILRRKAQKIISEDV